jgi:hypothetical protein
VRVVMLAMFESTLDQLVGVGAVVAQEISRMRSA